VSQQLDALCDNSPILAPARLKRCRWLLAVAEANEAEFFERLQQAEAIVKGQQQQEEAGSEQ
jgi:hypothetical protein